MAPLPDFLTGAETTPASPKAEKKSRKAPRCNHGKPCGRSCIRKDETCRIDEELLGAEEDLLSADLETGDAQAGCESGAVANEIGALKEVLAACPVVAGEPPEAEALRQLLNVEPSTGCTCGCDLCVKNTRAIDAMLPWVIIFETYYKASVDAGSGLAALGGIAGAAAAVPGPGAAAGAVAVPGMVSMPVSELDAIKKERDEALATVQDIVKRAAVGAPEVAAAEPAPSDASPAAPEEPVVVEQGKGKKTRFCGNKEQRDAFIQSALAVFSQGPSGPAGSEELFIVPGSGFRDDVSANTPLDAVIGCYEMSIDDKRKLLTDYATASLQVFRLTPTDAAKGAAYAEASAAIISELEAKIGEFASIDNDDKFRDSRERYVKSLSDQLSPAPSWLVVDDTRIARINTYLCRMWGSGQVSAFCDASLASLRKTRGAKKASASAETTTA